MDVDIKKLTSCGSDWEINRYNLLNTFKRWQNEFRKNKLYPTLEYAESLQQKFNELLAENIESKDWLDREINSAYLDNTIFIPDKAHQISFQLNKLIEFVGWTLTTNNQLIDEGLALKEFVLDNLNIKPLCEADKFKGKGYIAVPDNNKKLIKIYLYELTINWTVDEPKELLDLTLLRSIPNTFIEGSVEELILKFVKYSQGMYDPMIYVCNTDLDFSYDETIFPVVKEKLLSTINVSSLYN